MAIATITRRRWVGAAVSAGLGVFAAADLFGASEFWNKKDPSTWTSDEVLELATKSPWARSARVLPKPGRDRGSALPSGPDVGGGGGGRSGNPRLGEVPVVPVAEVTVVWESAQPLLDALKSRFPSDFANHYVIGVNDLPTGRQKVNPENIVANLQARGRDSVDAGAIQPTSGGSVVLFAFSKELLPLRANDRDVLFSLDTDRFSVKAKFDLKEMMYRG